MARSRLKLNWKQRRFVRHLLDCGNGAEAARRAKYMNRASKDCAAKLLKRPWLLVFALRLEERRRLRRRPVAANAVKTLSNKIPVVLDGRGDGKPNPEEQAELLRHRERLQRLPPEPEIRPALRAPAPPPLELAPAFRDLLKPSRYKAVHGGRGSGKSHVFAELLVRRCVDRPIRAVCIREVQRSLDQSVKRLIEDKIQALGLGPVFTVQADRILGPGGRPDHLPGHAEPHGREHQVA
ncbi:phage terminase large subunit [Inquilinus limosus]|uniref:phage terminase large subunit n=1 Tax=Inquilinus limosus TaxID=171674 RepID=UPI003F15707E